MHVKVTTSPGQGTPPVMLDVRVPVLRSTINVLHSLQFITRLNYFSCYV